MTYTTTPASARTDTAAGVTPASLTPSDSWVRRRGLALTAGAGIWSAASFGYGFTPDISFGIAVTDVAGFLFQLGVFGLVQVQLATRATGLGRGAVALLKVERVLLVLAMAWSLIHGLVPSARDEVWLAVLDVFWPLSMLGMFVIAVKLAFAGRWAGLARFWPLVAESWAVVCLPVLAVAGPAFGEPFAAAHLLYGYATLGLIVAARPAMLRSR